MRKCDKCNKCKRKPCIKTGKPCRKVENWLLRQQSKEGYSERQIRRKEIPYPPEWFNKCPL